MTRAILAIVLVGLAAASAVAGGGREHFAYSGSGGYDFFYTNDDVMTANAGSFGIKATLIYGVASGLFDETGEARDYTDDPGLADGEDKALWVPITMYYGITDELEFGVQPKFINDTYTYTEAAEEQAGGGARADDLSGECTATGVGDTWIYAKYMLSPEPMVTARLGVKVPTGDDEGNPATGEGPAGDGQMDIDGALMFGIPAGSGQVDAAIGYRYRMARKDVGWPLGDPDENLLVTWNPGAEIHFAEEDLQQPGVDSARNAIVLAPGFDYVMQNGVGLGVDFFYPLTGQNIDNIWGVGFSVMWGM